MLQLPLLLPKFGAIVKGVGLGVLMVNCMTAVVLFGKYCDYTKYKDLDHPPPYHFFTLDPATYNKDIYDCAATIVVFGVLTIFCCFISIAAGLILDGLFMAIAGALPLIFTVACIISEGLFFNAVVLETVRSSNELIRNSSSAQKYIKSSIKELYQQAEIVFKKKGTTAKFLRWEDVEKKIGDKVECNGKNIYFNYPNIWTSSLSKKAILDEEKSYFNIYLSGSNIMAQLGNNEYPIASTNFEYEHTYTYKPKYHACWTTTKPKFSCKTITNSTEKYLVQTDNIKNAWTIKQYLMLDKSKYVSNSKDEEGDIHPDYLISGFPIAYGFLDTDTSTRTGHFYDDHHFRVSGKQYIKYLFDISVRRYNRLQKRTHYWCSEEPTGEDSFKKYCQRRYPHFAGVEYKDFQEVDEIELQFDYVTIKKYPSFVINEKKSEKSDEILIYHNTDRLAQFAIAALVINGCGMLFLILGVAAAILPALLFKGPQ